MLNKNLMVAFFFLFLGACEGIPEEEDGAGDDAGDVSDAPLFVPICSDPFDCTPERACDLTPVVLSYSDLEVPFKIEGSFTSPHATYGVADDAFFSLSWNTIEIGWTGVPEGSHSFSIEFNCEGSLWTVTKELDGEVDTKEFSGSCSFDSFNPALHAAPDCSFDSICTAE
jgi:hypothetical protein